MPELDALEGPVSRAEFDAALGRIARLETALETLSDPEPVSEEIEARIAEHEGSAPGGPALTLEQVRAELGL